MPVATKRTTSSSGRPDRGFAAVAAKRVRRNRLLACAPGEQHDLPLTFGLALRGRGWRIVFLGADTPAASIAHTAERLRPAVIVVSSVTPRGFRREADTLAAIAREHRLAIAGAGASERLAESLGSSLLQGDPVAAASEI